MVLRGPCYLALSTLLHPGAGRPDGIILVAEDGRSLTARDVVDITGLPVVATVEASRRVARTVDAGLLPARITRLSELAQLRPLTTPAPTSPAPPPHPPNRPVTNPSETHTDLPLWRRHNGGARAALPVTMSRPAHEVHLSPVCRSFTTTSAGSTSAGRAGAQSNALLAPVAPGEHRGPSTQRKGEPVTMPTQASLSELLTPGQVAEYLGVPTGTLANWRYLSKGPAFLRVGRHVRYRLADLVGWVEEQVQAGEPPDVSTARRRVPVRRR